MNNEFNEYDEYDRSGPTTSSRNSDRLGLFSLVLGVVSVPMVIGVFPGLFLGIIAIVLGVISRINYGSWHLQNALGVTFGAIAMFLASVMFLAFIILLQDPATLQQLTEFAQMYYGY